LINTLRNNKQAAQPGGQYNLTGKSGTSQGNDVRSENDEKTKPTETVPNPPSFYEEDMQKWKKKF
jgi:hypothetical protein